MYLLAAVTFCLAFALAAEPPPATPRHAPAPPSPPATEEMHSRAWLGVLLEDATDGGVEILALVPGGPAQRAGLHAGDLILELNRVPVGDLEALGRVIQQLRPGSEVVVRVLRGDEPETISFRAGQRGIWPTVPEALPELFSGGSLGLALASIPGELRRHYGAPPSEGALIVQVEPDGAGARAGARVGDVLVRAAGHPISTPEDLRQAVLRSGGADPVLLDLVRAGRALRASATARGRSKPAQGVGEHEAPPEFWPPKPAGETAARIVVLEAEIARLQARIRELERQLDASRTQR